MDCSARRPATRETCATLVGLLLLAVARAQAQEPTVLSALGLEPVAWARWEIRVPDKRLWLARSGIPLPPAYATHPDDFLPYFHLVDVDGDGRADIVYSGPAWCSIMPAGQGPLCEGSETNVFRNAGTRFVPWIEHARSYRVAALAPGDPPLATGLVLDERDDYGECLTTLGLRFLRPSSSPAAPALVPDKEVRYVHWTQWPSVRLPSPLRVRVTQNQYNLRWAPAVDDTTRGESCEWTWRGNILATFGRGAQAVALADLQDGTRTWYFVMTDSGTALTSPFQDVRSGPRLLGWMSARYLEPIRDTPSAQQAAPPSGGTSTRPPARR